MKTGQGRLILRDGSDVPLDYCFATLRDGTRRHGSLFGDLSKIDWGEFAYNLHYHPADGTEFPVLITTFGDGYLTFVSDVVQLARERKDKEVVR
ncbi:hypothetical protein [Bosea sp. BK604]|uniref:hypothetical protein n=1 Tax=Bosea sp. BK604 TaxID=2512180 RepID=UPI0010468DEF|nr:hypothetical protein [Bosea sp. BK604]TCR61897.1 hypothetical protein EV560_112239 [Bosea sp. BK604]